MAEYKWWGWLDLNQRPIGYEPTALTTELQPHERNVPTDCKQVEVQDQRPLAVILTLDVLILSHEGRSYKTRKRMAPGYLAGHCCCHLYIVLLGDYRQEELRDAARDRQTRSADPGS